VFYFIISNLAIAFCFVPILLVFLRRINQDKAYLSIGVYWMANGLINVPIWLGLGDNKILQNQITLLYNLLDGPLVLLIFYFSSAGKRKRAVMYALLGLIALDLVLLGWKGHNFTSSTVIIGAGTLLALIFSTEGIAQYFRKMEHTHFENAMGFVYAALVFDYGIFIIIYIFSYVNKVKGAESDANFFIYYLSLLLSVMLTSFGLLLHARPSSLSPSYNRN